MAENDWGAWGEWYGERDLPHTDGEYNKEETEDYSAGPSHIADILSPTGAPRLIHSDGMRPESPTP